MHHKHHRLFDLVLLYDGTGTFVNPSTQEDGDGQTEAPGVLAESGRSDTLIRRMLPYLT